MKPLPSIRPPRPTSRPAPAAAIGVLLVNLGTPDAADAPAVRRYLKEFLSDPRVIENQGVVWKAVLNGVILPIRPRIKAKDYQKIWNVERNEFAAQDHHPRAGREACPALAPLGAHIIVDWAMRYGNPSIESRLASMIARGCERLLIMPLYPQYSAATTATVCDEVFRVLMGLRRQPTVRVAAPYYDDKVYIDALAASMRDALGKLTFEPEVILASYHGMPEDYIRKGDPYEKHCIETTRLLRAALGMTDEQADADVPVALRPRQVARARDRPHRQGAGQARRQVARGGDAGLLRRLPGDAGGDRGRERAHLPQGRRRKFRGDPVSQRQRAGYAAAGGHGAAGVEGLGFVGFRRMGRAKRNPSSFREGI